MSESKTVVVAPRRAYRADARIEASLYSVGIPERYFPSLLSTLRNFSIQHIDFGLEAFTRLTQSPHISFDDSLGLIPTLVEAAREHKSTLVKQDEVLAEIAIAYLAKKRMAQPAPSGEPEDVTYADTGRRIVSPTRHSWRKHEREAKRNRRLREGGYHLIPIGDNRLLLRIVDSQKSDGKKGDLKQEREALALRLQHTNDILEYFGINDGRARSQFLRGFNGDYHDGADVVRRAYSLGVNTMVFGAVRSAKAGERQLFVALANYVYQHGEERARALLELVGPEKFGQFTGYIAARVGSEICLIGDSGNQHTVRDLESTVKKWEGPTLMNQRRYVRGQEQGFVIYTR